MLEGLDNIEWFKLSHAYGEASDVPQLIRALASKDTETVSEALYELYGNIWHQGTVYPETPHAVPFLVELLMDPATHKRDRIIVLIQSIAQGSGYLAVHDPQNPDVAKESKHVIRSHEAVAHHFSDFLSLVNDPSLALRRQLPSLLCSMQAGRDWLLSNVERLITQEPDACCAAHWIFATSRSCVGSPDWADRLQPDASAPPIIRLAMAHVNLASGAAPVADAAARTILSAFANRESYKDYASATCFVEKNTSGDIDSLFTGLTNVLPSESMKRLIEPACDLAPQMDNYDAELVCVPLLPLVFESGVPDKTEALSREQRILVQQVSRTTHVHHGEPVASILAKLEASGILSAITAGKD